jgi:hypothetical protein
MAHPGRASVELPGRDVVPGPPHRHDVADSPRGGSGSPVLRDVLDEHDPVVPGQMARGQR